MLSKTNFYNKQRPGATSRGGGDQWLSRLGAFSCGKPVGHLYEEYLQRVENGEDPKIVMDELGLKRYCCRALFLGHVDLLEKVARFKKS